MRNKWIAILLFFLISCQKTPDNVTQLGFYHWQTELKINKVEFDYLEAVSAKKLYVKFFDVDWNTNLNQAQPTALVEIDTSNMEDLEIIPTLFITNRTFKRLDKAGIIDLANKVAQKIRFLALQLPQQQIKEVQIDCDWSGETRANYWTFLEELQEVLGQIQLSATIRLHQIKYFERTGVPPVARGMLMFYNMGNLEEWESENSIIDLTIARQYVDNFEEYPLPLDVALPLFQWGVVYRDGKFVKLINQLTINDLERDLQLKKIAKNRYQIQESTYLKGLYLYKNDLIRLEQCDLPVLQTAAVELSSLLPDIDRSLVFYHLDERVLSAYSKIDLQRIVDKFEE